jgi:hypothetical protein
VTDPRSEEPDVVGELAAGDVHRAVAESLAELGLSFAELEAEAKQVGSRVIGPGSSGSLSGTLPLRPDVECQDHEFARADQRPTEPHGRQRRALDRRHP